MIKRMKKEICSELKIISGLLLGNDPLQIFILSWTN